MSNQLVSSSIPAFLLVIVSMCLIKFYTHKKEFYRRYWGKNRTYIQTGIVQLWIVAFAMIAFIITIWLN